jgi:hypothetical protein
MNHALPRDETSLSGNSDCPISGVFFERTTVTQKIDILVYRFRVKIRPLALMSCFTSAALLIVADGPATQKAEQAHAGRTHAPRPNSFNSFATLRASMST